MEELLIKKAQELFSICDVEDKGYITKGDMKRLQSELPLHDDQLAIVFDSLDNDHNERLTLEEFSSGFGKFLNFQQFDNNDSGNGEETILNSEYDDGFNINDEDSNGTSDDLEGMWMKIKENQPELLDNLQDFIEKIFEKLNQSKGEYRNLQASFQNKVKAHEEDIRKLYDEIETQVNYEKSRLAREDELKKKNLKKEFEDLIKDKEKTIQELLNSKQSTEDKFRHVIVAEIELRQINENLIKSKNDLEMEMEKNKKELEEYKSYMNQIISQQKEEKRNRAKNALQVTEGIAIERETLVKELDILKAENRKLQDERDEVLRLKEKNLEYDVETMGLDTNKLLPGHDESQFLKRGSVIANYFERTNDFGADNVLVESISTASVHSTSLSSKSAENVFKIIILGDSGVGKTSFLHRVCSNEFQDNFQSTIGVDFKVKNLEVDDKLVVLQLWDTAGQERYRSIIPQYFRRVDGVIMMFDSSNVKTFNSIRNWISEYKQYNDQDAVVILIGNKYDLVNETNEEVCTMADKLAQENDSEFFRTSARTGESIQQTIESMARKLIEKENTYMSNAVQLKEMKPKKGCCK